MNPASLMERAHAWAATTNHAPSGDNSQPWTVALAPAGDGVALTLALDEATRAAPSLFDCAFVASYLSLGAFARNFTLMAATEGLALQETREAHGVFTLRFAPGGTAGETAATADLIRRRCTNRLPFRTDPLDDDSRRALQEIAARDGLVLREFGGDAKARLAGVFAALDRFRYRNAQLYHEFLGKLRFGAEATRSPDGLRDSTLGVPGPSLLFLRLLRALRGVRAVRAIYFIGFERLMAFFGCVFLIRRSAAVCVLAGGDDTPLGWFRLGGCFQELWLETTRRGLALQPLGTTLLLYRLAREARPGATPAFTPAEQAFLASVRGKFQAETGLGLDGPALAFRTGRGPEIPSASLRRPLVPEHR